MKITKLKLRNFRCFGPEESVVTMKNLTTFIGINSSGKTAVLQALVKLFGRSASTRELTRADFHVPAGMQPEQLEEQDLYIEAVVEFPELENTSDTGQNAIPQFFQHMTVEEPGGTPYVRMRLEATWRKGATPDGEVDQNLVFITLAENLAEDIEQYKRPIDAHHRSLIEITYVPAIRNPSAQLKNASGTILWRVLNGIRWPENIDDQIRQKSSDLEAVFQQVSGFSTLQGIMGTEWRKLHSDVRYNHVDIKFSNDDLQSILQKLDVKFSPTEIPGSYDIDSLGEGLRSLFYLSLVSSLLEIEALASKEHYRIASSEFADDNLEEDLESKNDAERISDEVIFDSEFKQPPLTILAIEEPENHIAPHLLGRIMENLHNIANKFNAQVVVSSHSPAIVKRVEPETLRYLRICKERMCSIVKSILLPDALDEGYKYVKEAVRAYPEIYFARLVILGEGDTEEIIIPKALEMLGSSLDANAICVTPLGSRFVNHFWRLLQDLDIPYITLLDFDLGRGTGGWSTLKYILKMLDKYTHEKDKIFRTLSKRGLSISDEKLESLHKEPVDVAKMKAIIEVLETYDVFFAYPLDMDFMMLSAFAETYTSIIPENGGPRIPNRNDNPEDFKTKIEKAAKATLKSEDADITLYTEVEQLLMVWYVYFFLGNRGKPSSHILALSQMKQAVFEEKLPQPIRRLVERASEKLNDDPFSRLFLHEV